MPGDIRTQQDIRELLRVARGKPNQIFGGALDGDFHIVGEFETYVEKRVEAGIAAQIERLRNEYAANMSVECSRAAERAVLAERMRIKHIIELRSRTVSRSATPVAGAEILDEALKDWLS